jgi:hypothetical protein
MDQLSVGDRIFVHVPTEGYVGVGTVTAEKTPVTEFEVDTSSGLKKILSMDLDAPAMDENAENEAQREYLVGVAWIDTRPISEAYWETGMHANQNTVTKLRNRFTLDRLYQHFDIDE